VREHEFPGVHDGGEDRGHDDAVVNAAALPSRVCSARSK
jgi:hypothetical protein